MSGAKTYDYAQKNLLQKEINIIKQKIAVNQDQYKQKDICSQLQQEESSQDDLKSSEQINEPIKKYQLRESQTINSVANAQVKNLVQNQIILDSFQIIKNFETSPPKINSFSRNHQLLSFQKSKRSQLQTRNQMGIFNPGSMIGGTSKKVFSSQNIKFFDNQTTNFDQIGLKSLKLKQKKDFNIQDDISNFDFQNLKQSIPDNIFQPEKSELLQNIDHINQKIINSINQKLKNQKQVIKINLNNDQQNNKLDTLSQKQIEGSIKIKSYNKNRNLTDNKKNQTKQQHDQKNRPIDILNMNRKRFTVNLNDFPNDFKQKHQNQSNIQQNKADASKKQEHLNLDQIKSLNLFDYEQNQNQQSHDFYEQIETKMIELKQLTNVDEQNKASADCYRTMRINEILINFYFIIEQSDLRNINLQNQVSSYQEEIQQLNQQFFEMQEICNLEKQKNQLSLRYNEELNQENEILLQEAKQFQKEREMFFDENIDNQQKLKDFESLIQKLQNNQNKEKKVNNEKLEQKKQQVINIENTKFLQSQILEQQDENQILKKLNTKLEFEEKNLITKYETQQNEFNKLLNQYQILDKFCTEIIQEHEIQQKIIISLKEELLIKNRQIELSILNKRESVGNNFETDKKSKVNSLWALENEQKPVLKFRNSLGNEKSMQNNQILQDTDTIFEDEQINENNQKSSSLEIKLKESSGYLSMNYRSHQSQRRSISQNYNQYSPKFKEFGKLEKIIEEKTQLMQSTCNFIVDSDFFLDDFQNSDLVLKENVCKMFQNSEQVMKIESFEQFIAIILQQHEILLNIVTQMKIQMKKKSFIQNIKIKQDASTQTELIPKENPFTKTISIDIFDQKSQNSSYFRSKRQTQDNNQSIRKIQQPLLSRFLESKHDELLKRHKNIQCMHGVIQNRADNHNSQNSSFRFKAQSFQLQPQISNFQRKLSGEQQNLFAFKKSRIDVCKSFSSPFNRTSTRRENQLQNLLSLQHIHKNQTDKRKKNCLSISLSEFSGKEYKIDEEENHNKPLSPQKTQQEIDQLIQQIESKNDCYNHLCQPESQFNNDGGLKLQEIFKNLSLIIKDDAKMKLSQITKQSQIEPDKSQINIIEQLQNISESFDILYSQNKMQLYSEKITIYKNKQFFECILIVTNGFIYLSDLEGEKLIFESIFLFQEIDFIIQCIQNKKDLHQKFAFQFKNLKNNRSHLVVIQNERQNFKKLIDFLNFQVFDSQFQNKFKFQIMKKSSIEKFKIFERQFQIDFCFEEVCYYKIENNQRKIQIQKKQNDFQDILLKKISGTISNHWVKCLVQLIEPSAYASYILKIVENFSFQDCEKNIEKIEEINTEEDLLKTLKQFLTLNYGNQIIENFKNLNTQQEKTQFIDQIIKDKFSFYLQLMVGACNIIQKSVSERIFLDQNIEVEQANFEKELSSNMREQDCFFGELSFKLIVGNSVYHFAALDKNISIYSKWKQQLQLVKSQLSLYKGNNQIIIKKIFQLFSKVLESDMEMKSSKIKFKSQINSYQHLAQNKQLSLVKQRQLSSAVYTSPKRSDIFCQIQPVSVNVQNLKLNQYKNNLQTQQLNETILQKSEVDNQPKILKNQQIQILKTNSMHKKMKSEMSDPRFTFGLASKFHRNQQYQQSELLTKTTQRSIMNISVIKNTDDNQHSSFISQQFQIQQANESIKINQFKNNLNSNLNENSLSKKKENKTKSCKKGDQQIV